MRDLLLALLHLAVTAAKLCRRGGVRAVIAENLLLKQQLIVLRRARQRAPNLKVGDRLLCGFGSLVSESGTDPQGRHRGAPGDVADLPSGAGTPEVPPLVFFEPPSEKARARRGRVRRSSGRSSVSKRAILDSGARGIARIISQTFGVDLDNNLVHRVLAKHYRPSPGGGGPSWLSFIGQTADSLWSVDLFRCESIVLQSYWVLVVMGPIHPPHRRTRRAPRGRRWPQASAACSTTPFVGEAPLGISVLTMIRCSRLTVGRRICACSRSDEVKTVPHVPLSHPFVERLIGTIRREFSRPRVVLERAGPRTQARRFPNLLQRGPQPRVVGGQHPVRRHRRKPHRPCRTRPCALGLSLSGAGPAPDGSLTTNSKPTPEASLET